MTTSFGTKSFGDMGRKSFGIGVEKDRERDRAKVRREAKENTDIARGKLLDAREKLKQKERENEAKMKSRKAQEGKNLNPLAYSTMPSREYAKSLRNTANLSTLPKTPKYSLVEPRERIYGKRFELNETR
jgi:phage-related minor tail protein